jgi:hypothetical protein
MRVAGTLILVGLHACSAPPKGEPDQPAVFVQADTQDPATIAPADYTCLGSRMDPAPPTTPTSLTVEVTDFEKKTPVPGATVEVFLSLDRFTAGTPDGTSTVTGSDGRATLVVPPGAYRVIFRTTADSATTVPTIEFNRRFDDPDRFSVSEATKLTIEAVLRLFPDDNQGVVAGGQRDCRGRETGGTVVEVASSGGPVDPKNTFYFVDASRESTVPARGQKWATGNGVFATLNVPPGNATITARGLLAEGGELTRLGTGLAPVRAGSVTVVQLEPLGPGM